MANNPLLGLLAALLPEQQRAALERRGAEPLGWSVLLGVVELFAGIALLASDALTYFPLLADKAAERMWEIAQNDPQAFAKNPQIGHVGAVIWLAWLLRPYTGLLLSIVVVGALRLIVFGINGDVIGEPFAWLAVRAVQTVRRLAAGSHEKLRFGPDRPDRLIQEADGHLVVLSNRPKADWNERITLEIGERFYRLLRVEERQDGSWWAYAHLLEEAPAGEVIRYLIRYLPPGS